MTQPFPFINAKPAKFTTAKKISLVTAISLLAVGSLVTFKTLHHSKSDHGHAHNKHAQHTAKAEHGYKQAIMDVTDKKLRHDKLETVVKADQVTKQATEQARKKQADEQAAQQQAEQQAEQQAQQQVEQQAQQQAAQQQAQQQAAEQQAAQPAAPQAAQQQPTVGYTVAGYSSASSTAIQGIIDSNLTAWVSISDMSTAGGVAVFGHTDFAGRPSAGAWIAGASVGEIVTVSGVQYKITNKYIVNYLSAEEYDAVYGAQPGELVFITCATYDKGTDWVLRTQRM